MRLRHRNSGAVVHVSADRASSLPSDQWEPADLPKAEAEPKKKKKGKPGKGEPAD